MIVYDFDVVGVILVPAETDAPLIINSNTVLAFAIAGQRLQSISRRQAQKGQLHGSIDQLEFTQSPLTDVSRNLPNKFPLPKLGRGRFGKGLDHESMIRPEPAFGKHIIRLSYIWRPYSLIRKPAGGPKRPPTDKPQMANPGRSSRIQHRASRYTANGVMVPRGAEAALMRIVSRFSRTSSPMVLHCR